MPERVEDRAARVAAGMAAMEGDISRGPVLREIDSPHAHDDMTAAETRLAVLRGGPLSTIKDIDTIAVPARPCLHFEVRDRGHWAMLPLGNLTGLNFDLGERVRTRVGPIHRYLYAGRSMHGAWLYDYAGEVDPATGCVPAPRGFLYRMVEFEPTTAAEPPPPSSAEVDLRAWAEEYAAQGDPTMAVACAKAAHEISGYMPV